MTISPGTPRIQRSNGIIRGSFLLSGCSAAPNRQTGRSHQRVKMRRRENAACIALPGRADVRIIANGGAPTTRGRAHREEGLLAYVPWTRARLSLTLIYDPAAPSQFMLEAFEPDELRTRCG
jgi:hypothetical protein